MNCKLGVYLNKDGETESVKKDGILAIYEIIDGDWVCNSKFDFRVNNVKSLKELRIKSENLVKKVEENCIAFVAKRMWGITQFMLKQKGIGIWECPGKPEEFLDYIFEKEVGKIDYSSRKDALEGYRPRMVSPGKYAISLVEIQIKDKGIRSKELLEPLIDSGDFREIEVRCTHTPRWLEIEAEERGLELKAERQSGDLVIYISNN